MNSLMPVFVRDVLNANPAHTVYILAPGALGFLAGSMLGPWLMDRRGERAIGIYALGVLSLGVMFFGLIDQVAPVLAPISPLNLLTLVGIELSPQMRAAGLISILTAFGSTAVLAAVQTYINRHVVQTRQAAMFGMQEVIDNAIVLITLLAVGGIATAIGSRLVFLVAPPLLVIFIVWLIRASFRMMTGEAPPARLILDALFDRTPWEQHRDERGVRIDQTG
jgi:MFS family permease